MHALRRFIQKEMDERGWQQVDLVKASGLMKQQVGRLINDDRQLLPQMPRGETMRALAKAFSVPEEVIRTVSAEAAGITGAQGATVIHEMSSATDAELLRELLARTELREGGGERDERGSAPIIDWLTRELQHARLDLEDYKAMPNTEGSRKQRESLRVRIEVLEETLIQVSGTEGVVSDSPGAETAL